MKLKTMQLVVLLLLGTGTIFAQDIPKSKVPSVIINNFNKEFPKANDIEWKMQGDLYNVDFEIGWFTDYEAWFTASGKLVKYTQEISKSDLPISVRNVIKNQYKEYRIDDVEKIIENNEETYKIELEKQDEDFDVIFNKNGKIIK